MSTILDALRKLQREREDRDARGDLQRSVTHSFGLRPRRRIGRWIALLVLALGAGAAWYLAPAGSADSIVASLPLPEWLGGAAEDEAGPAPEPRTPARRARRAPAQPALPPPTAPREEPTPPQSVAALNEPPSAEAEAPAPPVPIPPPQAGAPGLRTTPLPPPATEPAPAQVAQSTPVAPPPPPSPPPPTAAMQPPPPAPAAPTPAAAPPTPPTPAQAAPAQVVPVQPPPAAPAPTRATQAPASTASESTEREETRERVKRLVEEKSRAEPKAVAPTPTPTPTPTTTARTPEADDGDFPAVRVQSVRWHPDKERREARIDLAEVGPVDIHEGDIVSGLLVVRIEPGAVELQLGSAKRRVSLGP